MSSTQKGELPDTCLAGSDPRLVRIALENGLTPEAAQALADIDAAMGRVRRSFARRDFGRVILAQLDSDLEVSHLDAIGAIGNSPAWGDPADEVTVGLIAERLGIDPSRASRIVADVVERGYARRIASQSDARRICLELTEKGEGFVAAVREGKWRVFSAALGKWRDEELVIFARLLDRFGAWTSDGDGLEAMRGLAPARKTDDRAATESG